MVQIPRFTLIRMIVPQILHSFSICYYIIKFFKVMKSFKDMEEVLINETVCISPVITIFS